MRPLLCTVGSQCQFEGDDSSVLVLCATWAGDHQPGDRSAEREAWREIIGSPAAWRHALRVLQTPVVVPHELLLYRHFPRQRRGENLDTLSESLVRAALVFD